MSGLFMLRSLRRSMTGCALTLGLLPSCMAKADDISVFTSGAPSAVQEMLAPQFSQATGHRVTITAATLNNILKRLAGDARADVVVLPRPAMERIDKAGALRGGSLVDLARVGIGVAVRADAPVPDISNADALRRALLNAKSIAHPDPKGGGFTGAHIDRMFERLGIADTVRPKVVLAFAFTGGVAAIAKGEAELGLFNISEIVPVKGVRLIGPLPAELQNHITFAGALHARAAAPGAGAAYLRWLATPGARDAWSSGGMEALSGQ